MPVYLVKTPGDGQHLVDAPNQASARSHVARKVFKLELVSVADAFRLSKSGLELETVNDPAAQLGATEQITSLGHSGGPGEEPPAEEAKTGKGSK